MPRKRIDITGQKFGKLTVTSFGWTAENRASYWNCKCDCGNDTTVAKCSLTLGRTVSCGCYQAEQTVKSNTTHGMHTSPEYHAWDHMIQRCTNPNNKNYADYGGRGITVCARWLFSFENFLADMGVKPAPHLTLERVDNSLGYFASNCKWASMKEQSNNRRARVSTPSRNQQMD